MPTVHILGYHTCKTEGGWSYVNAEAPFLSGSGKNQWLTQGFYFWTDSDYFAHIWGSCSYNNDYAIVECNIEIKSELILDLVGSVVSQKFFASCLEKYRTKLKQIDPSKEPTVEAVISYWRNKASIHDIQLFPFVAIKAQDEPNKYDIKRLSFIGTKETMVIGIQRQQICLFESGVECIAGKKVIYPADFKRGALS